MLASGGIQRDVGLAVRPAGECRDGAIIHAPTTADGNM
jgi:hypothetical protein